jgi:hypothetical protein
VAEDRLEGCYSIGTSIGTSAAGAAGAGGDSGWDAECWGDFSSDCEAHFEGEVLQVGTSIDARWCDVEIFGGLRDLSVERRRWLVIGDGNVALGVVLGRPTRELDVEVGDRVEATMVYQNYHADFMWGMRLTLTKNGELLALLNDNLPIDQPTQLGDLTLSRAAELCHQPEDGFTCTYVAHDLEIQLDDEGISVSPHSSVRIGPYEVLTDENFDVRDGGACDTGDTSDFLIARVRR